MIIFNHKNNFVNMRNSGLVLFACAGLLLSGGAIMGGSAGWTVLRMSYHFWTSDLSSELGSGVLLVAGSILCLPACWLATLAPYHPRAHSLLATLMFLSTAALLVLSLSLTSLSALSRTARDPALFNATMHRTMARTQLEPAVRQAYSSMQLDLHCCGVQSHADWYKYRRNLPAACCNKWATGKRDFCETPLFTSGCLKPSLTEFRYFVNTMSVFCSIMIIVLSVTLFAAAYSLVSNVIESNNFRVLKNAPFRVACLHTTPNSPVFSIIPAPPASTNSPLRPAVSNNLPA